MVAIRQWMANPKPLVVHSAFGVQEVDPYSV